MFHPNQGEAEYVLERSKLNILWPQNRAIILSFFFTDFMVPNITRSSAFLVLRFKSSYNEMLITTLTYHQVKSLVLFSGSDVSRQETLLATGYILLMQKLKANTPLPSVTTDITFRVQVIRRPHTNLCINAQRQICQKKKKRKRPFSILNVKLNTED